MLQLDLQPFQIEPDIVANEVITLLSAHTNMYVSGLPKVVQHHSTLIWY